MIEVTDLPAVNATLNATAAVLLGAGYAMIRSRRVAAHRACMLAAFAVSVLFLACYAVYHASAGSRPFTGQGPIGAVRRGRGRAVRQRVGLAGRQGRHALH